MKKSTADQFGTKQKLALHRETLRDLTADQLRRIAGGASGTWLLGCRNSSCCWTK